MNNDKITQKSIDSIKEIFERKVITDDALINLMRNFRLYLEAKNLKNEYKELNLYCDWLQHPILNRNGESGNILLKITQAFSDDIIGKSTTWINDKINEVFGQKQLKENIIGICFKENITPPIIHSTEWKLFYTQLLRQLINKPIIIDKANPNFKKIEKVTQEVNSNFTGIISLEICDERNEYNVEEPNLNFKLTTLNDITIVTPLLIID